MDPLSSHPRMSYECYLRELATDQYVVRSSPLSHVCTVSCTRYEDSIDQRMVCRDALRPYGVVCIGLKVCSHAGMEWGRVWRRWGSAQLLYTLIARARGSSYRWVTRHPNMSDSRSRALRCPYRPILRDRSTL